MELMDSDLGEAVSRGSPVLPPAAASAVPLIDDESDAARPTKRAKHARSGSKGRALSSKPPREKSPLIRPISALHILQGRSPSPRPMHGRSLSPHNHAHGPQMMKKSPAALTLPHPAAASASSFLLPSAAMHSHAHSSHSHSHPAAHAAGSHANVPPAYPIKMTKAFRAPPRNALEAERMKLPIFQAKDEILTAVQQNDNIIVIGETGSGKTTQIPQYLLSSGLVGRGQIACTQPRRVAAISVAQRVAQEYGCTVGQQVGYSIRFELVTSPATRIKYITDGMLLREIMADPLLQDYNAIVLDEAHERTVNTDILFALLKQIQRKRKIILQMRRDATEKAKRAASPSATGTKSPKRAASPSASKSTLSSESPGMRPLDLEKDKYPPMSKAERRALRQKRKREAMEGKAENGTSATPAAAAAPASSSTAPSSSTQAAPADTVDLSPSFQLDNDSVPPLSSLRDPSSLQELKLVIMSATLSAQKFSDYFASAPVLSIPGRTFPVDLLHSEEAQADYLDSAIVATLQVHLDWRETFPGDMLVFLTGSEEIETARKAIEEKVRRINEEDCPVAMQICTLYANLPSEQQLAVFEKPKENTRKVILSTNIAETSLTIPGIRYVIDTGVTKLRLFNPRTGGEVLKVVDVSQAEANQRSGRAGRDAPGVAYRLYTEESYAQLKPDLLPEILRSNLSSVVLQLKSLHVGNVLKFDFMTQPSRAALTRALEDLYTLRALTYNGSLSAMGRMMVHFPLPPAWARMLLVATEERFGCAVEIAKILAIMSVEGIFFASSAGAHKSSTAAEKQTIAQRKQFAHMEGDHFTYLDAFNAYLLHSSTHSSDLRARIEWCRSHHLNYKNLEKAKKILDQLAGLGQRLGLQWRSVNEKETGEEYGNCTQTDGIKQCLLHGLFHNVARKQAHDASYVTLNDSQTVYLHPSSVLIGRPKEKRPELLVFNTLVHTSRAYMRECMVLPDLKWLVELVPEAYAAGGVESANAAANGHSAGPLAAPTIKGGKQAHLLHERLASENSNQSKLSKVVEQARKKEAGGIGTTLKGTSHSKPSGSNSHQPHGGANRSKSDHQVKSEGGASTGSNRGGKATGAHTPVKSHHTSNGAAASSASTDKPQHREPRPPKEKKQNSKLKTKGDHLMDFINDL